MQFLARAAQQSAIGSVLHEHMLEQESSVRGRVALEHQTCVNESTERILQFCFATLRDGTETLLGPFECEEEARSEWKRVSFAHKSTATARYAIVAETAMALR